MPVEKYYFGVDLAPVRKASRQGKAIGNGSPAEVTPLIVGTRVGNDSADTCAPCCFYLLVICERSIGNARPQTPALIEYRANCVAMPQKFGLQLFFFAYPLPQAHYV
jgi:hypothetical protein